MRFASTRAIIARRELAVRRQQPLAALVALADDRRPRARLPVVELLLELALDDAALLLDDDDLLEPVGELRIVSGSSGQVMPTL